MNPKVRNAEAIKNQFEHNVPNQSCYDEPELNISDICTSLMKQIMDDVVGLAWEKITSPKDIQKVAYMPKKYKCPKCGKEFAQFLSSLKHCNKKKGLDEGAFCPICGKKLALKRNLRRHIKEVHEGSKEKPVKNHGEPHKPKCGLCGKVYSSKNKLVEHLHNKHGVARKGGPKIKCSKCDFEHASHSRIKAHMTLKHSSSFDFECSFCDAKFKSKGGREKHTRIVHKQVKHVLPPRPIVATRSVPLPIEVQNSVQFPSNNNQYRSHSDIDNGRGVPASPITFTDGIQAQITSQQFSRGPNFTQFFGPDASFQFSGQDVSSQPVNRYPSSTSSQYEVLSPSFNIQAHFQKLPEQVYSSNYIGQTSSSQLRNPVSYFSSVNETSRHIIQVPSGQFSGQQQSHQSHSQFPGQVGTLQSHNQVLL